MACRLPFGTLMRDASAWEGSLLQPVGRRSRNSQRWFRDTSLSAQGSRS